MNSRPAAPQLGEHEIGEVHVRREIDVARAPLGREVGEAVLPSREAGLVLVDRRQVDGHVEPLAGLDIDEPEVTLEDGIELLGREDVHDDELRAGRREVADHAVGGRVEQV